MNDSARKYKCDWTRRPHHFVPFSNGVLVIINERKTLCTNDATARRHLAEEYTKLALKLMEGE
jgi:hypothetical protein